jgi:hypothetical protein
LGELAAQSGENDEHLAAVAVLAQKVLFNTCSTLGVTSLRNLNSATLANIEDALGSESTDGDLVSLLRAILHRHQLKTEDVDN